MGSLTIPDPDDELRASLRELAERHGRSVEEEAQAILHGALGAPSRVLASDASQVATAGSVLKALRAVVDSVGGVELDLPRREPMRDPPDFTQ